MRKWGRNSVIGVCSIIFLAVIGCGSTSSSPTKPHVTKAPGQTHDLSQTFTVADGVKLQGNMIEGKTEEEVRSFVELLAYRIDKMPSNAYKRDKQTVIIPEEKGRQVDVDATVEKIRLAQPGENVEPVVKSISPKVTKDDLMVSIPPNSRRIGTFSTPILDRQPERVKNIISTTQLLNNTVLEPGQEFSFHRVVGIPTRKKGFKQGTVYGDGGMMKQEICEGVCQVSFTLYNVALDTGMKVTERHPHSEPVPYVRQGRDATISDDKDFRFINPTKEAVIIKSRIEADRVYVIFYQKEKTSSR
jgi:vancomycin resistance protein YoaR